MLENENDDLYFDDNCIIEDDYYKCIKNLVTCKFCDKILKDPVMCTQCQEAYCKNCVKQLQNENEKHKCENPSYIKNLNAISMLGKIKYLCKNCKNEIKQEDIEEHLNEGCIKHENPKKLIDTMFKKNCLQKLDRTQIKFLSVDNTKINHISGKINNINSIFCCSNIIGEKWCWKIIFN